MKCFVSGVRVHPTSPLYVFGESVVLPLSQQVFAKFILAAESNPEHKEIMSKIAAKIDQINAQKEKLRVSSLKLKADIDVPDFANQQLSITKLENELNSLMMDKAISGVAILEEIHKEYNERD